MTGNFSPDFEIVFLSADHFFVRRMRQPPTDPVNSLLSFGYTLLHTNVFSMVRLHGMNPYIGFFHAEEKGNPALVNDLIEEFRWVVDSLVLYTLNKGILKQKDFYYLKEKTGCFLKDEARKRFLEVFEERMAEESAHPLIGAKMNLRRQVEVQVKLFKEVLAGKRQKYEPYKFKL